MMMKKMTRKTANLNLFAPILIVLQMTSVLLQDFAQLGLSVLQHAASVMSTIGRQLFIV